MSKRMSTTKLDHENWDEEEPPEEAGTFSSASTEVLKKRVILKAQRRKPTGSGESGTPAVPNIFQNIKLTSNSSAPPPSLSFLGKNANETPKTESPLSKPQPSFVFSSTTSTAEAPSKPGEAKFSFTSTKPAPVTVSESPSMKTSSKSDANSSFVTPKSPASAPTVEITTALKPEVSSTFASLNSPSSASAVETTMAPGSTTNAYRTKKNMKTSAVTSTTDGTKPAMPPPQSLFGNIFGNSIVSAEVACEKTKNRTDTGQFSFTSGAKKNEAFAEFTNKLQSTENENKNADPPSPNGFIDKDKYYLMLKGLNNSVANWIKENVDKNPHCILTPIFSDYITHLNDIKAKYGKVRTGTVSDKNESVPTNVLVSSRDQDKDKAPPGTFMVNGKDKEQGTRFILPLPPGSVPSLKAPVDKPQVSTPFSFSAFISQKTSPKPEMTTQSLLPAADKPAEPASSSSNLQATMESKSDKTEENYDDDDTESPEPTPTPVVEEGAVYSKRCKVFVKKSGSYQDRGVGTAFIKPVVDNTKTQLIVRADTVLGNVLLNTLISSAVPIQRLGPNNVAVVCVPTPDEKPPPTTVLLRVKTTADAEELYEKLSSYKK